MKLPTSDLVGFIKQRHFEQVRRLKNKPTLAIAVVGSDLANASFIRAKQRYGDDIGLGVEVVAVPTEAVLISQIKAWNDDANIAGMVVQLPLPGSFNTEKLLALISPSKDVDGLGPNSRFEAATAKAVMWILASQQLKLAEASVCVVGQGRLVGLPVSRSLELAGAQVDRCDIDTADLTEHCRSADIVITGVGKPGLIKRNMLKDGAIVIDAGTAAAAGQITGDADPRLYDEESVLVTTVPGGVGPMTVVALFDNLLIVANG